MPNTSIDKAEHPDGNGVACGRFLLVHERIESRVKETQARAGTAGGDYSCHGDVKKSAKRLLQ